MSNTTSLEWSSEMGSRSRAAWLLIVSPAGEITVFRGATLPGLCVVTGSTPVKNGKWSHTKYRLTLAAGVRALSGKAGWETGEFLEGLAALVRCPPIDSWEAATAALGVTRAQAEAFIRGWKPGAAEKLDANAAALAALGGAS